MCFHLINNLYAVALYFIGDSVDVDTFVEESLKMSRFKHIHVMELIGVCLDGRFAPLIIMPYMANGSLLKYLRQERDSFVLTGEHNRDEVISTAFFQQTQNVYVLIGSEPSEASWWYVLSDS